MQKFFSFEVHMLVVYENVKSHNVVKKRETQDSDGILCVSTIRNDTSTELARAYTNSATAHAF